MFVLFTYFSEILFYFCIFFFHAVFSITFLMIFDSNLIDCYKMIVSLNSKIFFKMYLKNLKAMKIFYDSVIIELFVTMNFFKWAITQI